MLPITHINTDKAPLKADSSRSVMTPEREQILKNIDVSRETNLVAHLRSIYQERLGLTEGQLQALISSNNGDPSHKVCPKCQMPTHNKSYCNECRNAYSNTSRPKYSELSDEERMKSSARAYANQYQKRGLVPAGLCSVCGSEENLEKHHEDYSKPLEITWLCRSCHKKHHTGGHNE